MALNLEEKGLLKSSPIERDVRETVVETAPTLVVFAEASVTALEINPSDANDWINNWGFICATGFTLQEEKKIQMIGSFNYDMAQVNDTQGFGARFKLIVDDAEELTLETETFFDDSAAADVGSNSPSAENIYFTKGKTLSAGNHYMAVVMRPSTKMAAVSQNFTDVVGSIIGIIGK